MSERAIKSMAAAIIGCPGIVLCICQFGWAGTVGVILMMWGNNIMLDAQNGSVFNNEDRT